MSQALFCLYSQKKQSWKSRTQIVQSGGEGGGETQRQRQKQRHGGVSTQNSLWTFFLLNQLLKFSVDLYFLLEDQVIARTQPVSQKVSLHAFWMESVNQQTPSHEWRVNSLNFLIFNYIPFVKGICYGVAN